MYNVLGIFIINGYYLYTTAAISMVIFSIPYILYKILKRHSNKVRYLILTLLILNSFILYSTLSYHTIIMLVFPLITAYLYNRKKLVVFTLIISMFMIVGSHLLAFKLKVVEDEPLVELTGVILYGILPRIIQLFAIGTICIFITKTTEELTRKLISKNAELYEDQRKIITTFSEIIEAESSHTGKHVKRVSEYTALICRCLGYNEETTWKVAIASTLHDIGKIIVPKEILDKPGRLTSEEFDEIKKHITYGKNMLENAEGEVIKLSECIAYHHHEKWNGKGYLGLKGEEINEFARIVALADVFDALISKRPYKDKMSYTTAYDIIVKEKGEHFEPRVVEVFEKYYSEFININLKYPEDDN